MSLPLNFCFVWDRLVAGSAHPALGGSLHSTLQALGKQGIGAVISLTEHPLDHSLLSEFGMDYLHLPIEDFTAPTLEQMQSAIEFIRQQEAKGHAVLVHCQAGIGRTGTILAAWMATQYMDAQQAIDHVRQLRPGSLEVPCQEQAIYEFVTHLKDRKSY